MLSAPLRDRFGVVNHMEFYTVDELKHIIVNSAKVLGVEIDDKGAYEMARRSRGTQRLANRLLKQMCIRDRLYIAYEIVSILKNMSLCGLPVKKVWRTVKKALSKYTNELPTDSTN